jgi:hypothetical protein
MAILYFFLLLFGWWLPAAIYFGLGIYCFLTFRRRRTPAIFWLISFVALFAYSAYEGFLLKWRLDHRAVTYAQYIKYADLPADIDTIVLTRSQEDDTLTGHAQSCSVVCAKLLLDSRFKTVIVAVKDRMLFNYSPRNLQAVERSIPPQSYDVYTVVNEPGCQNYDNPDFYQIYQAWRLFGRCIHKRTEKLLNGRRYLEVTTNEDMPGQPPWRLRFSTHLRVVDAAALKNLASADATKDIARVEYDSVNLAYWFPVPGLFPHRTESGFPTDFWPDLLRFERHYGPFKSTVAALQEVTGAPLDKPIPLPKFEEQTPENQLRLARQILLRGPMMDRYRFTQTELAAQRPFNQDYRELILEFIAKTNFSGEGYYQMIQYIGWLAAGDPGLAPVIAKMYVERAATNANGAAYARALSHFKSDALAPHASALLALYERRFPKSQDTASFRASLNFGIGGARPDVVDKLIAELGSDDALSAASAAAALCRAADPRATEPLLEKLQSLGNRRYAMSYAYALARLGRGKDAQAAIKSGAQSERVCLSEIVEKFPSGGAPDSICLLDGPFEQAQGTQWQFSNAQLRCLAPRTPSPNGY